MRKRPLVPTFSLNKLVVDSPIKKLTKILYQMDLGTKEDFEIYLKRMRQKGSE